MRVARLTHRWPPIRVQLPMYASAHHRDTAGEHCLGFLVSEHQHEAGLCKTHDQQHVGKIPILRCKFLDFGQEPLEIDRYFNHGL